MSGFPLKTEFHAGIALAPQVSAGDLSTICRALNSIVFGMHVNLHVITDGQGNVQFEVPEPLISSELPTGALGDLLTWNATPAPSLITRASGADGQVLTHQGAGAPAWEDAPTGLPTQTGNAGKLLKTDGSAASWISHLDSLAAALDGGGSGFLRFDDAGNTFTMYLRMTASLLDSQLTTISDTFAAPVMLWAAAGANKVFTAMECNRALAQYVLKQAAGTAGADDQVLTIKTVAGSKLAVWADGAVFPASPVAGDMLYYNGSAWVKVTPIGAAETVLKSTGSAPSWGYLKTV